ncbi:cyclase family protein [Halobacterium litoreum]|uniref:Cyclase family protein n=1 Tax=Halobacterium litoreum TaxID=2039234 RepID=A0ABD5NIW8_9EURY|nr:cyclase family protein [Halobacterium litoreum]UHH12226.1 cyclase family protein [Halobacterium litoreum]
MTVVDLSHELGSGLPYPGDPPASVTPHATMQADGYRVAAIACSTHSGTHLDAPAHLLADGATLGDYAPGDFQFDARVVDCTDLGDREPIPADRVPETDADLVVFHTGFDARWGDESYFDHPYLASAAAERCAAQGCAVGLDAPSVDPTPTDRARDGEPDGYPAHRALLGEGLLLLENLTNLGALGEATSVRAHPLPVDADGAPARVVAVTD